VPETLLDASEQKETTGGARRRAVWTVSLLGELVRFKAQKLILDQKKNEVFEEQEKRTEW